MLYCNGNIFTPDGYVCGGFRVENGRFVEVLPGCMSHGDVDLSGNKVIPGLVDIHTHGSCGADCSDGNPEGLRRIAAYNAARGITSFVPTTMTLPYDELASAFAAAGKLNEDRPDGCARVAGIHMEGPFLSEKKKGAQNGEHLRKPDFAAFLHLFEGCSGLIRLVGVAPELPGAMDFIKQAAQRCMVSLAHTDADYETASAAFDAGAGHVTHLFNAMPAVHHRRPGVIGAACERENVTAELICDGLHVHPSIVRMAFRLFPGRICLVSDSIRCCGMPDGTYELGGQKVLMTGGAARLPDGTLAGGADDLYSDLCKAIRFGIPEQEAISAATLVPARVIGAGDEIGSIEPGKHADFVVCSRDLKCRRVYMDGVPVSGENGM